MFKLAAPPPHLVERSRANRSIRNTPGPAHGAHAGFKPGQRRPVLAHGRHWTSLRRSFGIQREGGVVLTIFLKINSDSTMRSTWASILHREVQRGVEGGAVNFFEPSARSRRSGSISSLSSAACGVTAPTLATLAHVVACRGSCAGPLAYAAQSELCERERACCTT